MKFSMMPYNRPDVEAISQKYTQAIGRFKDAKSVDEQVAVIQEITTLRHHIDTQMTLAQVRHVINTEDAFYDKENDFFDEQMPVFEGLLDGFYHAVSHSPFKDDLKARFGEHFFNLIDMKLKTFSPEIVEDLKKENQLKSQYTKLKASAKIIFDGKELNLSQMSPYTESVERATRKEAQEAITAFYKANEAQFDDIYHQLVQVRHLIAQKLGFDNFIELGYMRLTRTDYGPDHVESYRQQVLEHIVPLASTLRQKQKERLSLEKLYYYDEAIAFQSGNATPKGDSQWILDQGIQMYQELSPETKSFIEDMVSQELMDLEAKKGKAGGGFCTFIPEYKAPFIFSNFNGTSGDIDVLTHEAGHAFQVYQSRHYDLPEYTWPTLEACEIHSMSMEFLTWPWMKRFFKEDEMKYKFNHLSEAILFIPYGVLVDAFQHFVYANPSATPEERKNMWRELEKKYLPHRDYESNAFLEAGGFWFKQGHIFQDPFYYIDYTLAQVCAFQFFALRQKDPKEAWEKYLALCNLGGSMPFVKLIEATGLKNPFTPGTLSQTLPEITAWLSTVDDLAL